MRRLELLRAQYARLEKDRDFEIRRMFSDDERLQKLESEMMTIAGQIDELERQEAWTNYRPAERKTSFFGPRPTERKTYWFNPRPTSRPIFTPRPQPKPMTGSEAVGAVIAVILVSLAVVIGVITDK